MRLISALFIALATCGTAAAQRPPQAPVPPQAPPVATLPPCSYCGDKCKCPDGSCPLACGMDKSNSPGKATAGTPQSSSVRISTGLSAPGASGTVVASVDGKSYVLTAFHVFHGLGANLKVVAGEREYQTAVIAADAQNDLLILSVDAVLPAVPLADTEPTRGEPVEAYGVAAGNGLTPTRKTGVAMGRTSWVEPGSSWHGREMQQSSIRSANGDSGAGVFCKGRLCGVIRGGRGSDAMAIDLHRVKALVAKVQGDRTAPTANTDPYRDAYNRVAKGERVTITIGPDGKALMSAYEAWRDESGRNVWQPVQPVRPVGYLNGDCPGGNCPTGGCANGSCGFGGVRGGLQGGIQPLGSGAHSHTCSRGHTWSHRDGDPGASHNCPVCGEFQNVVSEPGRGYIQPVGQSAGYRQPLQPQPIYQSGGCVGDSCGAGGCTNGRCGIPSQLQPFRLDPQSYSFPSQSPCANGRCNLPQR